MRLEDEFEYIDTSFKQNKVIEDKNPDNEIRDWYNHEVEDEEE